MLVPALLFLCFSTRLSAQGCDLLCNKDFEATTVASPGTFVFANAAQVSCWKTTEADNIIEVWGTGFNGVPAYNGQQFIELNANVAATIYQEFSAAAGTPVVISFAHRGRVGVDVMSVELGPVGGPYMNLGTYSDGTDKWGYYTVNRTLPSKGKRFVLRFTAVTTASGDPGVGNFLDAISVNLEGPKIKSTQHDVSTAGGHDGSATVRVVSGTGPYSYAWSPSGGKSATATGLAAGNYSCIVTDGNGCVVSNTFTITAPEVSVTSTTNTSSTSTTNTSSTSTTSTSSTATTTTTTTQPFNGVQTAWIGFSLMPGYSNALVTYKYVQWGGNPAIPPRVTNISRYEFLCIARGIVPSDANPTHEDLFKKYNIRGCPYWRDTIFNKDGFGMDSTYNEGGDDCSAVDDLWRLRYPAYPFTSPDKTFNPGPGWATGDGGPTQGQADILKRYGAVFFTDPILGEKAFLLLHDMQDPGWRSAYRGH